MKIKKLVVVALVTGIVLSVAIGSGKIDITSQNPSIETNQVGANQLDINQCEPVNDPLKTNYL
ncbi:hypothetical protein [Brevibacillus laterosporus]|nr:hypothetical protein [Brevibacillus laterosporus]ERM16066.1 hypothetical protein P615_05115 [Brevibacillus laterosporus PE36]